MRAPALILAASLLATAAPAQTSPFLAYPPQNDTVSLNLAMEDWVKTDTARVVLAVDAAMPGADAGKARGDVLAAVKSVNKEADWRFTGFDRSTDNSGLERWHATLEARMPEAQLGGLGDRAEQVSKPGLQVAVDDIDFTPTLAETEAARSKLRVEFYKRVNDELARLNQAEPDRKFRLMSVTFAGSVAPPGPIIPAMAKRSMALAAAPEPGAEQDGGLALSQKVQLQATVTFAAVAPRE